ncbi:putative reverse transcriptase domain-containing protein [Tanacetum coccineum]
MIQSAILKDGILTDNAVRYGTLTRNCEKRKEVEETSKQGGSWKDNKKAKVGKGFVVIAPPKNEIVSSYSKCAKCSAYHPEVNALQDPNIVTGTFSLNDHFTTVVFDSGADFSFISTKFAPLLNVKPSIVSLNYVIEVANGKEEVDRIIRDCKLELGNSLFTIDLISLGHGSFHVIVGMDFLSKNKAEIVCHEKVVRISLEGGEILRVQGNPWSSLIPLSRGSFDVLVGMDRLSKRKFGIVCHEKVDRILLEGDEILWVHGERTEGVVKTLMNTKVELQDKGFIRPSLFRGEHQCRLLRRGAWSSIEVSVGITEEGKIVPLVGCEIDEAHASRLKWMIYLMVLADAAKIIRDAIRFEYWVASSSGWTNIRCALFEALNGRKCRPPVLWVEIRESSLTGLELVQGTIDKVTPWKGVVCFGNKGKIALRYIGPFEILEKIGLVVYRLRLPKELNSVHGKFHVLNLKKCLVDANLHIPLSEIKVNKTLRFFEELIGIMDREVKRLNVAGW